MSTYLIQRGTSHLKAANLTKSMPQKALMCVSEVALSTFTQYPLFSPSVKSCKSRISCCNNPTRRELTIQLCIFVCFPYKLWCNKGWKNKTDRKNIAFYQVQQKKRSQEVIIKLPRRFMMSISRTPFLWMLSQMFNAILAFLRPRRNLISYRINLWDSLNSIYLNSSAKVRFQLGSRIKEISDWNAF